MGHPLLKSLGREDAANALYEYAAARDPVNPTRHVSLGWAYGRFGEHRWDAAIASLETALRLSADYISAHYLMGTALLYQGKPEAALAAMERESSLGYRLIGQAIAYHALRQPQASDAALAELIEKYERDAAYNIAYVLAYRDEADRAFSWLDKAVAYSDPGLNQIGTQIEFSGLHDDPRWGEFLECIGKSPEQLDAIEFEVTLPQ